MFRGFTGCMLGGGALVAGAVLGDITIMLFGAAAGLLLAAASCWAAERKMRAAKRIPYPSYRY